MGSASKKGVTYLEGAAILKLLTREDETLLVWRDSYGTWAHFSGLQPRGEDSKCPLTLLVLDLGLDGLDGVGTFDLRQRTVSTNHVRKVFGDGPQG